MFPPYIDIAKKSFISFIILIVLILILLHFISGAGGIFKA